MQIHVCFALNQQDACFSPKTIEDFHTIYYWIEWFIVQIFQPCAFLQITSEKYKFFSNCFFFKKRQIGKARSFVTIFWQLNFWKTQFFAYRQVCVFAYDWLLKYKFISQNQLNSRLFTIRVASIFSHLILNYMINAEIFHQISTKQNFELHFKCRNISPNIDKTKFWITF